MIRFPNDQCASCSLFIHCMSRGPLFAEYLYGIIQCKRCHAYTLSYYADNEDDELRIELGRYPACLKIGTDQINRGQTVCKSCQKLEAQ